MLDYIPVSDLGNNRDKFLTKVTRQVGKGNWFWIFVAKNKFYSWEWGIQFYEDAFYSFFRKNIDSLQKLCLNFSDVCVKNRFDIESGLNYKKQTQHYDHFNDIALRRCLIRFGVAFRGKDLLNLDGTEYDQQKIPFHLPHLIRIPDKEKTVQSWLNSNRFIAVATTVADQAKLSEILIK
ncbi:MAG: hypothetical protein DWQ19_10645 [Crenarchaeota archaeon]|nr:MAG: hypothetical protein DWQ19_10645 [Thermoproteota archaeon]